MLTRADILQAMDIPQWQLRPLHGVAKEVEVIEQAEVIVQAELATAAVTQDDATPSVADANPVESAEIMPAVAAMPWPDLQQAVQQCQRCSLGATRTQTVFGVGNQTADLMIIGEAPGEDEDRQGEPFAGSAGQLLNKMLLAIGLQREQVYIANIVKCRPPGSRVSSKEEADFCSDYLHRQITLVQPKLMLSVGKPSANHLLGLDKALDEMRGQTHTHKPTQTPVLVTYHPAELLQNPKDKRKAWEDLQRVQALLA